MYATWNMSLHGRRPKQQEFDSTNVQSIKTWYHEDRKVRGLME